LAIRKVNNGFLVGDRWEMVKFKILRELYNFWSLKIGKKLEIVIV
jgi:hypothetical protein